MDFKNQGGFGGNVTSPFKQEAFALSTKKTARATIAQSANTLLFHGNEIIGDNTDGIGLLRDLKNNIGYSLTGKKILMLGAGGAARGILHPLLMENPAEIMIANRTVENAKRLCDAFSPYGKMRFASFGKLGDAEVDVVIDSTNFDADIPLPVSLRVSNESLFYDLKYSAANKSLAPWVFDRKFDKIVDGYGMLMEQAREAFHVWTGVLPMKR